MVLTVHSPLSCISKPAAAVLGRTRMHITTSSPTQPLFSFPPFAPPLASSFPPLCVSFWLSLSGHLAFSPSKPHKMPCFPATCRSPPVYSIIMYAIIDCQYFYSLVATTAHLYNKHNNYPPPPTFSFFSFSSFSFFFFSSFSLRSFSCLSAYHSW